LSEGVAGLKRKVAMACRILGNAGLADYLGHVSGRIPGQDHVLIRARGLDTGSMASTSISEILEITLGGKARDKKSRLRPPVETPLHTQIYLARKDVESVVHVHAATPVIFSLVDLPILPVFNQGAELAAEGIPVYQRNGLVATVRRGDELAAALGPKMSCILLGHGVVTVGRTVEEATVRALRLDRIARMNLYARLIGELKAAPQGGWEVDKATVDAEIGGEWNYQEEMLESTLTRNNGRRPRKRRRQ
jgi:ribulose-5-phosphate 4-epimerase/fuculose-1-phosphate aldolase